MLEECIVLPGVFDPDTYEEAGACGASLAWFKHALHEDCIVRDLADGGWSRQCVERARYLHRTTGEIVRKLATANRLRPVPSSTDAPLPTAEEEWLAEARASDAQERVLGIVSSHATKLVHRQDQLVASIERLPGTNWWQGRSTSRILARSNQAYGDALTPILRQARSLMFIDPNLDPSSGSYAAFGDLLAPLASRQVAPRLEIHRSIALGDGPTRSFPGTAEWRKRFDPLHSALAAVGLRAEVMLWDDFHDRHLVSDVIGISASAGFDVTTSPTANATWTRLGARDKEAKQREFDENANAPAFRFKFDVGA